MTWVKIDDQFHAHPKTRRAWKSPRALGLHILALSYCASQLTDGVVDSAFVEEKVPTRRERDATVHALLDAGLWELHEDGFVIHDYLDHNPSRETVLNRRRVDADRKARGNRSESRGGLLGIRSASDRPVPSRPVKPGQAESSLTVSATAAGRAGAAA